MQKLLGGVFTYVYVYEAVSSGILSGCVIIVPDGLLSGNLTEEMDVCVCLEEST